MLGGPKTLEIELNERKNIFKIEAITEVDLPPNTPRIGVSRGGDVYGIDASIKEVRQAKIIVRKKRLSNQKVKGQNR